MSANAIAPRQFDTSTDTPLQTWIGTDEGSDDVRVQLHKHIADMGDLCRQVRLAREESHLNREALAPLFDELIETIEQHRGLIADRLSELAPTVHA